MKLHQTLTNHLLIAMPALEDPNFSHTVTYICEHSEDGAMGIVLNRPLDLPLSDVLEHLEIPILDPRLSQQHVFLGGPVDMERGFVVHTPVGEWDSSMTVSADIGVTTSRDILQAIARGEGPERYRIALGYAGWGSGQLESELGENSWLSTPATPELLFATPPEQLWQAAASELGIDMTLLSQETGHA